MLHCECHVNGSGDSFLTETKYSASGQHVLLTFFPDPSASFELLNLTLCCCFFFGQACSYLSFHRAGTEL